MSEENYITIRGSLVSCTMVVLHLASLSFCFGFVLYEMSGIFVSAGNIRSITDLSLSLF